MSERNISSPDFLLCCDCESPCYVFEWKEGSVAEAVCEVCGNQEVELFLTEEQYDGYAFSGAWSYRGR